MKVNFKKHPDGLVPVVVQDGLSQQVLMLGYMNAAALEQTLRDKRVTFYSRSKQRLWQKGETSGHYLELVSLEPDCDQDALLAKVQPQGPVCHRGTQSCFGEADTAGFSRRLEAILAGRLADGVADSYTARLAGKGVRKVAQKVGEEAVELVIEACDGDAERFREEAADLLYHYLLLLQMKDYRLENIEQVLQRRHEERSG